MGSAVVLPWSSRSAFGVAALLVGDARGQDVQECPPATTVAPDGSSNDGRRNNHCSVDHDDNGGDHDDCRDHHHDGGRDSGTDQPDLPNDDGCDHDDVLDHDDVVDHDDGRSPRLDAGHRRSVCRGALQPAADLHHRHQERRQRPDHRADDLHSDIGRPVHYSTY